MNKDTSRFSAPIEPELLLDEHGRFCGANGKPINLFDELFAPKGREKKDASKLRLER
jgi:hypothetical protein